MTQPKRPPEPPISSPLLEYLKGVFPVSVGTDAGATHAALMVRVGHAQVIEHLEALFQRQNPMKD